MTREYKTVKLYTVNDWRYAERLVQYHEWRVISSGLDSVLLERHCNPRRVTKS